MNPHDFTSSTKWVHRPDNLVVFSFRKVRLSLNLSRPLAPSGGPHLKAGARDPGSQDESVRDPLAASTAEDSGIFGGSFEALVGRPFVSPISVLRVQGLAPCMFVEKAMVARSVDQSLSGIRSVRAKTRSPGAARNRRALIHGRACGGVRARPRARSRRRCQSATAASTRRTDERRPTRESRLKRTSSVEYERYAVRRCVFARRIKSG